MDEEIENNINSYLVYGSVVKGIMIIAAIIASIYCFTNENTAVLGLIILVGGIISAFVTSMIIKWFGYTLQCLYDIKNATISKQAINTINKKVTIEVNTPKCPNCQAPMANNETFCRNCGYNMGTNNNIQNKE